MSRPRHLASLVAIAVVIGFSFLCLASIAKEFAPSVNNKDGITLQKRDGTISKFNVPWNSPTLDPQPEFGAILARRKVLYDAVKNVAAEMLGGESAIASAVSLETSVSTSTLQVIPVAAVDMSSNTINEINVPSTVTPQVSIDKNIMADLIEAANSIVAPMLATASGVSDLGILSVPSASYLAVPTTIYGGFTPQTASSLSVATIVPQMSGSTTTPLGSSGIPLSVVATLPNSQKVLASSFNSSWSSSVFSTNTTLQSISTITPDYLLNDSPIVCLSTTTTLISSCPTPVTVTCTVTETWHSTHYSETATLFSFMSIFTINYQETTSLCPSLIAYPPLSNSVSQDLQSLLSTICTTASGSNGLGSIIEVYSTDKPSPIHPAIAGSTGTLSFFPSASLNEVAHTGSYFTSYSRDTTDTISASRLPNLTSAPSSHLNPLVNFSGSTLDEGISSLGIVDSVIGIPGNVEASDVTSAPREGTAKLTPLSLVATESGSVLGGISGSLRP